MRSKTETVSSRCSRIIIEEEFAETRAAQQIAFEENLSEFQTNFDAARKNVEYLVKRIRQGHEKSVAMEKTVSENQKIIQSLAERIEALEVENRKCKEKCEADISPGLTAAEKDTDLQPAKSIQSRLEEVETSNERLQRELERLTKKLKGTSSRHDDKRFRSFSFHIEDFERKVEERIKALEKEREPESDKLLEDLWSKQRTVAIEKNDIEAFGWPFLLKVLGTTRIGKLDFRNADIGDDGAEGVAKAVDVNKTFSWICLNGNKINDYGAIAIAKAIRVNSSLKFVYMQHNGFGDAGRNALLQAKKAREAQGRPLKEFIF